MNFLLVRKECACRLGLWQFIKILSETGYLRDIYSAARNKEEQQKTNKYLFKEILSKEDTVLAWIQEDAYVFGVFF